MEVSSYLPGGMVAILATNLSIDTEYVFVCYASNVAGDGEYSDRVTVRTSKYY